ncbi:glycosyl hydrolase family 76-domain-containing protein [Lineolata rhizophorae]|uniref:Mannan endo-1,6-alpha-mannosidase n=1 Tax=Lineolata rhizophorae TaxID=578093 RepID=A0A6A6P9U3_9PEZI|nr:glycosyl hydrolase family 76-domain-containing protein [Lineolata rhizophorae]
MLMRAWSWLLVATASLLCPSTSAIELHIEDEASIRDVASTIAYGVMSYYTFNASGTDPNLLGSFPRPYYWWEAGAVWGGMVDYWAYTGDRTYVNTTMQALLAQVGPADNYMMPFRQAELGNDDQAFWGLAVLSALEYDFPSPPATSPQWLDLIEALWNTQASRWDMETCGGGLKWQIFSSNAGYNYKNAISNGCFFQMSARLARYTGNGTYSEWAERVWDWTRAIGLIDDNYYVYDGSDDTLNCSEINHLQWSYNAGVFLHGAAAMYNLTGASSEWEDRLTGLLEAASVFFSPFDNATNVMWEAACEAIGTCNTDQQSFKAYLARWLGKTAVLAAYTSSAISTLLRASAEGAAASCSGGRSGVECGSKWYTGGWDGMRGLGQQLAALEVVQSLLINRIRDAPDTEGNVTITYGPTQTPTLGVPTRTRDVETPGTSSGSRTTLLGIGTARYLSSFVINIIRFE